MQCPRSCVRFCAQNKPFVNGRCLTVGGGDVEFVRQSVATACWAVQRHKSFGANKTVGLLDFSENHAQ